MLIFRKSLKLLIFLVFIASIRIGHSLNINFKEIENLLSKQDYDNFVLKCKKKNSFIESPKCLNFIGIKLFLYCYNNKKESNKLDDIYNQAFYFLEKAAKNGSKQAHVNLGWIYSNNALKYYNLKKSSSYFLNSVKENISYKDSSSKKAKKNIEKINTSYTNVILAIKLIKKIEIYFTATKQKKKKYLTQKQYNNANIFFKEIIGKKNISNEKLKDLENKVLEDNLLIFDFLKEDLKSFNYNNTKNAIEAYEKLKYMVEIKIE